MVTNPSTTTIALAIAAVSVLVTAAGVILQARMSRRQARHAEEQLHIVRRQLDATDFEKREQEKERNRAASTHLVIEQRSARRDVKDGVTTITCAFEITNLGPGRASDVKLIVIDDQGTGVASVDCARTMLGETSREAEVVFPLPRWLDPPLSVRILWFDGYDRRVCHEKLRFPAK